MATIQYRWLKDGRKLVVHYYNTVDRYVAIVTDGAYALYITPVMDSYGKVNQVIDKYLEIDGLEEE